MAPDTRNGRFDMKKVELGAGAPQETQSQFAALCYRSAGKDGVEILLITSRDTGRWIIPKGWPMKGRNGSETALQEAFEEAGVEGKPAATPIGVYSYDKVLDNGAVQPCIVSVFPVKVSKLRKKYPEVGQRTRRWFTPKKAAEKVNEDELRALLSNFAPT